MRLTPGSDRSDLRSDRRGEQAAGVVDLDARRRARSYSRSAPNGSAWCRDFLATLTGEQLTEQADSPVFVGTPQLLLRQGLWPIPDTLFRSAG
jgi:hypothetical protein